MRWTARNQKMAAQLQAIERGRKSAAEMRLVEARQLEETACTSREKADDALGAAEAHWTEHLRSGPVDLLLQQALAYSVLRREHELQQARREEQGAEALVGRRLTEWRYAEAGVRSGEAILKRGARTLSRRSDDSREHQISERSGWKWFKR